MGSVLANSSESARTAPIDEQISAAQATWNIIQRKWRTVSGGGAAFRGARAKARSREGRGFPGTGEVRLACQVPANSIGFQRAGNRGGAAVWKDR